MGINEGTLTISFVLYTINMECMCDASYVTIKKICNFREKVSNFPKNEYTRDQYQ